jgi:biopolymer transport protein ExbD
LSRRDLWKAGELRQISLGDLILLILAFLLVCTTFAFEEALFLRPSNAGAAAGMGGDKLVAIRCSRDGRVEIEGRPATIDMVRPAIERALAADDRSIVVLAADRGNYALVVEVLDQVGLARAPRVVLRERGK